MSSNSGGLIGLLMSLAVASAAGFLIMAALMVMADWTLLQGLFAAAVVFVVLGGILAVAFSRPLPGPVQLGSAGMGGTTPAEAARAPAPTVPSGAPAAAPVAPTPSATPAPVPAAGPDPQPAEPEAPAKPATLDAARDGGADDLKRIKGVGPKLEQLLNSMGFYHFDQVAAWTATEVAWVDENLEGFKGRVSRDSWVEQAKHLAAGGDTEFSRKVDKGDVY